MKRRFVNQDRWGEGWFADKLSWAGKLVHAYMCENADSAGFIELRAKHIASATSMPIKKVLQGIDELKDTYILSKDGSTAWIKEYLDTQRHLPLNPRDNSHKGAMRYFEDRVDQFNMPELMKELGEDRNSEFILASHILSATFLHENKDHSRTIEHPLDDHSTPYSNSKGKSKSNTYGKGNSSGNGNGKEWTEEEPEESIINTREYSKSL